MRKVVFLSIVISLLSLAFLTSCEGDKNVSVHPIVSREITYEEMVSVLSSHDIKAKLKPEASDYYIPTPGATQYVVVIRFDIYKISGNATYDEVRVKLNILGSDGTTYSEDIDKITIITAIPQDRDREASVEENWNVAGNFAAAASDITGKIKSLSVTASGGVSQKESYTKLYQTVALNMPAPSQLVWTFTPFKKEAIPAGIYDVIAFIEVRDPTRGLQIEAHSSCIYRAPVLFGLFKIPLDCHPDYREHDLVPAAQPELAQTEPPQPEPPQPELVQSEPPQQEPAQPEPPQPELAQTEPPQPEPPLPPEEIVLVFGGWEQIREAVLDAVDWPSLMRDRNVNITFKDLEDKQVDVSSRERDVGGCQRWLAEAGYPDGYSYLHTMVLPGSEALTQTAEALGVYLADCGIGTSIEKINSTDAYQKLMALSAAGEAGLLLSIRVDE